MTLEPSSQEKSRKSASRRFPRKCRRLVEARRKAFTEWERASSNEAREAIWATYSELRKESRRLICEEQEGCLGSVLSKRGGVTGLRRMEECLAMDQVALAELH